MRKKPAKMNNLENMKTFLFSPCSLAVEKSGFLLFFEALKTIQC
jgi:hypothetical protein